MNTKKTKCDVCTFWCENHKTVRNLAWFVSFIPKYGKRASAVLLFICEVMDDFCEREISELSNS